MPEFTKSERGKLRDLAASVYEAEAHKMLEALDAEFGRWRKGEIQSSELLRAIHDFHQRPSRELRSMYQTLKSPEIVARGIALSLVDEPIAQDLRDKLEMLVTLFSRGAA